MDIKDIITLIHTVSDSELTSFEYQEGDTRLAFQANRERQVTVRTHETAVTDVKETKTAPVEEAQEYANIITSPMVGTFYSAPSEELPPFIQVGDHIQKGQVIGIVEAMKLMNEIESPYDGMVEEILVSNREMVGFEQMLVRVRP